MTITFAEFETRARARGCDQVLERKWNANQAVDEHAHPFAADALVVQGEMWLTDEAHGTRHLLAGDTFELDANVPHAERYGAEGATYWVGRRG